MEKRAEYRAVPADWLIPAGVLFEREIGMEIVAAALDWLSSAGQLQQFCMDPKSDSPDGTSGVYGSISFLNEEGTEVWATLRHLGRHEVSFDLVATDGLLKTSQVVSELRVKLGERIAYSGRATTTSVTPMGSHSVCSMVLDEAWLESGSAGTLPIAGGAVAFDGFLDGWQKYYHVRPEFKVVVADIQTLLSDLELWLSRLEAGLGGTRRASEEAINELGRELGTRTTPTLNTMFEKFEATAGAGGVEWRAAYRSFSRRQLNPLLLCAPFLHRTYRKPLGYAGDYEMVNMICRDPMEGSSLYARLVNLWFLEQPPAAAHRNRLLYLEQRIADVTVRAVSEGRTARVLSIGCGPALEVQQFLQRHSYADRVEFTLLDFNEETLLRTRGHMEDIKRRHHRLTPISFVRKSVMAILREATDGAQRGTDSDYDFVYCAGLFDYLTDPVCRRLSSQLFRRVRPGGLFFSTNVHTSNPWPMVMDFVMDWHLIYRTTQQLLATRPEQVSAEECRLTTDSTGVNVYLEATKPKLASRGSH